MNTLAQNPSQPGNATENAPNMHTSRTPLIAGAFMSSTLYAMLLCTREGRKWDREHTWFVVVLGVFLTLGWLALDNRQAAQRAFTYFIATGLPIIARSLFMQSQATDAAMRMARRGDASQT